MKSLVHLIPVDLHIVQNARNVQLQIEISATLKEIIEKLIESFQIENCQIQEYGIYNIFD